MWREFIKNRFLEHEHDTPSSNSSNLGKLQGKFITSDACNAARKVGRDLCARIDTVAEKKKMPLKVINNEIVRTKIEPCQYHQRNMCLDALSKWMAKYMKELL